MSAFLLVLVIVAWLALAVWVATAEQEEDYLDRPASHAVAHAEGWPCSCPGRQR